MKRDFRTMDFIFYARIFLVAAFIILLIAGNSVNPDATVLKKLFDGSKVILGVDVVRLEDSTSK
jgi:hypothetical protein